MTHWLQRLNHHYILVMMILTRLFGSVGGLLVIYYVELTLSLPSPIREHFRIASLVVVGVAVTLTVLLAMWETRSLRPVLKKIGLGQPLQPGEAAAAGREAVVFVARHHRHEAWLVPCSTLVPVLIFLKIVDDASASVMGNITAAVFMGIAMALMSTFFAVEYCMQFVIRRLLDHGVPIDYESLPAGKLRFRFALCFTLIIMTTALMIGTLARQRASDIIADKDPAVQTRAVVNLRAHSIYITIVAVLTGVVYSTILSNSVASRLGTLVRAMERVGGGNLAERVWPTGNDEVDRLARQFNAMVQRLEQNHLVIQDLNTNLEQKVTHRTRQLEATVQELRETQTRLTDVAHRAGMAEIATGVLHNVGNVLNSVNISVTVLSDRLKTSKLEDLKRFSSRLDQHRGRMDAFLAAERRGEKMLEYLTTLTSGLLTEQEISIKELDFLTEKVGHIKAIINAQQNYARTVCFREQVNLNALLHEVLEMHRTPLEEHRIQVVRKFADLPPAVVEKPKLVQVLGNLIKNAVDALVEAPCSQRVLTARTELVDGDQARIQIADTGSGVSSENLNSIFTYGFTTKRNGNGFGLHSSGLAMASIGGGIQAHSDGIGKGATFTITFPLAMKADQSQTQDGEQSPGSLIAAASHQPAKS